MAPRIIRSHRYLCSNGTLGFTKEKLHPNGYRLWRPGENNERIYGMQNTSWLLYGLDRLPEAKAQDKWISFHEGEHDCDCMANLGYVSTTTPCGAGKTDFPDEFWEPLRGAKVFIVGDRDEPGRRYVAAIASRLMPIVAKLRVYEVPPPHKDVADLLGAGGSLKELVPFEWQTHTVAAQEPDGRDTEIRVMTMQELMATPDIAPHDKLLEHMILRGSRFVVGAYTGEGKTTLALQILRTILRGDDFLGWNGLGNGTRALVIDVEQGRRTVKRRFAEAHLNEYPDQVRLVWVPDGLALDQNAQHVQQLERILANGLDGKPWDVVIADPLYKLHQGNPNDERKAVDLMRQFDRWREALGFALFLPMHCRKPQPGVKFAIHDISGSSAYTHGAEVIVGLQRVSKGFSHLHWWKDREGDLGCIGERWDLIHNEEGFHRDPRQLDRQPVRDRVRHALEAHPGMTMDELREETSAKQGTVQRALDDLGAVHDGERRVKDRHFQMPPQLFAVPGGAEVAV